MSNDIDNDIPPRWPRRKQEVGAVLWSSFLAACVATMVFFAFFDPLLLGNDEHPPAWLQTRMTGYAIGFFFFWFATAVAAALAAYLIDTIPDDSNNTPNTSAGDIGTTKSSAGPQP